MEYINHEIPQSEMIIISDLMGILRHELLINNKISWIYCFT